ncbi:MAG: HD domain-containing protein [Fuerstiella sp.]
MPDVDNIIRLFVKRGDSEYGGEAVTQRQHALQCALLAEREQAASTLIAAALLHDIGHLLHHLPDDAPEAGVDDVHEELGYRYLRRIFPDSVAEPVRLHVPAKRYLCATDPDYLARLSPPSMVSLELQGGPMSAAEADEFMKSEFAGDAVRLRRWDDTGKDPALQTPSLNHFVPHLMAAVRQGSPS